jgi:hypothetical protein
MNISWKIKVACAYAALGAMLGVSVVGCSFESGAKSVAFQPAISAAVNNMPEAAVLKKFKVQEVSVLCEKKEPADPFLVQIGYWTKSDGMKTIYTDSPCKSWNQLLGIQPSKSGWRVIAADYVDAKTAPLVVKFIARDLSHTL